MVMSLAEFLERLEEAAQEAKERADAKTKENAQCNS